MQLEGYPKICIFLFFFVVPQLLKLSPRWWKNNCIELSLYSREIFMYPEYLTAIRLRTLYMSWDGYTILSLIFSFSPIL